MADYEGQQLGNYRLLHLLGQGGFADVYLAEHIHLGTRAAIKVLSIRLTSDNVEHFRTEARTIAHLVHPHIVRVLDFGVEDGTPYLIMDYAPHGSLRQRHPNGTHLALTTIVDYVKQVAEALQYAHEKKLIHRDIKPANMLLGENQLVLLSDFGIALVAQSTNNQNIQKVLGTAAYMAPEQLQGKPRRASDQYALGIVVYEWLCGERPFHGSFTELCSQHLFVPPPSLCEKAPELPLAVEEVVLRALAKDPNQRFPSVHAFAMALEQAYQLVQFHPLGQSSLPNVVTAPPSQHSSPIDTVAAIPPGQVAQTADGVTSPSHPLEPANTVVPASQSSQITVPITPSPTRVVSPPKRESTPSGGLQLSLPSLLSLPSQRPISRRAVMVGLVGLTGISIVGGGIAWLARSQRPLASSPSLYSTAIPSSTPSPMGTTLYTYSGHNAGMRALAWSPDGKRVATASDDYTAQVWDATTRGNAIIYRGHISTYPGSAYQNHPWVNRVGWSPDGKHIVSCDQTSDSSRTATVQLWEAATGKTTIIYRGHTNGVYAVAWSPDGSRIASAGYDGTLQIWKAATGNIIATYRGSAFLFGLSWSPDSKYIAVGSSDAVVLVVNAANGSVFKTYRGHSNWVKDVAWSSDGKYIASGSDDEMVLLWNTATGVNFYTYNGHSGHINAVGWSPNGGLIASGGDTVQVWQGP